MELLLSVPLPLRVNVSMESVRLPANIPQEFKIYLVVGWALGRQLQEGKHTVRQQSCITIVKGAQFWKTIVW